MLNIHYGHNRELMKKCRRLEEYTIFVDTIRKNQAKGQDLQVAVEAAVESCIADEILADILRAECRGDTDGTGGYCMALNFCLRDWRLFHLLDP